MLTLLTSFACQIRMEVFSFNLLGLKGLVVKTHGSAVAVEIRNAIFQCVQFKEQKINEKIGERILADKEQQKNDMGNAKNSDTGDSEYTG